LRERAVGEVREEHKQKKKKNKRPKRAKKVLLLFPSFFVAFFEFYLWAGDKFQKRTTPS
jgi:cell division protein FtsB